MKCVFCLHIFGLFSTSFHFVYTDSTTYLTENFLANLEENLKDTDTDDATYKFIDKQVDNYINLIKSTRPLQNGKERKRRDNFQSINISKDEHDTYIMDKLTPLDILQIPFPQDVMLFKHLHSDCEKWYAVSLQKEKENEVLSIYRYNGSHFVNLFTESVNTGIKLGLHTSENGTFIVVAENSQIRKMFEMKSTVYLFTKDEKLERVQRFDVDYASDVSIWEDKGQIYMGISKEMSNSTGRAEYETSSVIYKWMGKHFDIIQHLKTSEARKIVPFVIGNSHFLAIPNRQNNLGDSNIYSEIFKYDLNKEKFVSYQKILTNGASDVKVFCFKKLNHHEYFLAVANTFSKDVYQNIDYKTKSLIYKFVDGYFIPFQSFDIIGVTEWLPVIGINGEFALFAACKHEGLEIFQYNGWKFVETETQFTDDSFGKGILSMNSYQFQGRPVVAVANQYNHGQMVNMYQVDFNKQNELNEFYDELLIWCKKSLLDAKKPEEKELSNVINNTPMIDEKEVVLSKRVIFNNLTVENLHTQEIENYKRTSRNSNDPELETLKNELEAVKTNLQQLENHFRSIINEPLTVINHDIFAENVIFEYENSFDDLITRTINNVDIKNYLEQIIQININGFTIPKMNLQAAVFENNVTVKNINNHKADDLLHTNKEMELKNLVINGDATIEHLSTKELINGVNITQETVLLVDGNQSFRGNLSVESINTNNAEARFLNNLPLLTIGDLAEANTQKLDGVLESLKIKNLIVGGYINDVDIPTLDKYALRIKGDQNISGFYYFDAIKTERFDAKIVNNLALPEELILINEGDFEISQDVQFLNKLNANGIFVSNNLNQIKVKNGKLDVLLKNSEDTQEIAGFKEFENIDVVSPFNTQGRLYVENDWINPVKRIGDEVIILEDVYVEGSVSIEGVVEAQDLASEDGEYSISNLKQHGLRIDEEEIPIHLKFLQQLNVENIIVDKINNEDVSDWIVNGVNKLQKIEGGKIFEGDLFITGDTHLNRVNGVNILDMAENILNVDGDQTIEGKLHVQHLTTDRLQGNNIKFSTHDWTEIITNDNRGKFVGKTTLKSVKAKTINCKNLNITGSINDINFNKMLEDTVFKNTNTIISGLKHFINLTVDNLTSRKSIKLTKIPSLIEKGVVEFKYSGRFVIPEDLPVEKVYVYNKLNHLTAAEFSTNWLGDKDQVISGDQFFEEMILYGDNIVRTNFINGVNLTQLNLDTVKIDEEHVFGIATFEKDLMSEKSITLKGHMEGLDIDTIVSSSNDEIFISDNIHFMNDVFVNGNVYSNSLINGLNFSALCTFAEPNINESPKSLIVEGNACFIKGPMVNKLNGLEMKELLENTWLRNKETCFNGNLYLNNVTFEDDIEVKGLFGDIKVDWLKNNYFSKSRNQTVPAKIEFSDGIVIKKKLFAPQATVGTVSGINLDEFVRTAILDDTDQVFEEALYAEVVNFNDLQGSFTVNDFSLETDVMRYDVPNIVTGKKTIQSANVNTLRMDRNFKVQDVDLLDWLQKGILKTGSQKIDGRVSFKGSTIFNNGINLSGLLNRNVFNPDNILLKSTPQTINGNKTFAQIQGNPSHFNNIKLKGRFNEMDISEVIHNQAFKNKPSIFISQVNFNTDIMAKNVVFEGYYQGVNVSQLVENLTNHVALNNYYTHFDSLYQVAKNVRKSLSASAHYLTYYKELQYFLDVEAVFPVKLHFYEDYHLAVVKSINRSLFIDFYRWIPEANQFIMDIDMLEIKPNFFITRIAPLDIDDETYLYIEYKPAEPVENGARIGEILSILNRTSVEIVHLIPNNGTNDILPFYLSILEKTCILMSYRYEFYINIYCSEENDGLKLYQKLDIPNAITATLTTIDELVYIIAINKGHKEDENTIYVWRSDKITGLFNIQQHIHVPNANDIAVIDYKGAHYLAISSGEIDKTMHTGQITIKRFHHDVQRFKEYQEIPIDAPISVKFSLLPSNELTLNILCDSSTKPLIIYKYGGLSKFIEKFVASSLEKCNSIATFNNNDKSYVITRSDEKFTLIEAVLKGY